jgi:hypothetical protein
LATRGTAIVPDWLIKILEQWSVIAAAPIPFAVVVIILGAAIWTILSWSYQGVISRRDAEIKLLERQIDDIKNRNVAAPHGELADAAELRLFIHGDDRTPSRVSESNIWRWYWLKTILIAQLPDGSEHRQHVLPTLYVNFDRPVFTGTLDVESVGFNLPLHEVKEFSNRFAIITFQKDLPAGTLIIRTHK